MKNDKRRTIIKRVIYGIIILLVLLQFVPVERTNPTSDPELDFLAITNAPKGIRSLVKTACYDCHSHSTEWPWYSKVAPVKFVVSHHVEEGREELNFSTWGSYEQKKKDHKLEECAEMVKEHEMPITGYDWTHPKARLTETDREKLVLFFSSQRMDI